MKDTFAAYLIVLMVKVNVVDTLDSESPESKRKHLQPRNCKANNAAAKLLLILQHLTMSVTPSSRSWHDNQLNYFFIGMHCTELISFFLANMRQSINV